MSTSDTTISEPESEPKSLTETTESNHSLSGSDTYASASSSGSEQSDGYERGKVNCGDDRQCKKAKELIRERLPSETVFPNEGKIPNYEALFKHFKREGKLFKKDILKICKLARRKLKKEPNLLRISSPVLIIGDLHGQFFDLVSIIEAVPICKKKENHFLFLGDYVDRGNYGFEIVMNHECKELSKSFNFRQEVLAKYDKTVYKEIMKTFECLPLAAIVDKQFFCVHAGISPHLSNVEMINGIDRFREPPRKGLFTDLLWSDPFTDYNSSEGNGERFVYNSDRRCSFQYSYDAVVDFLIENDLMCVIRAHEAQQEGYQMYKKWEETSFPSLITVFSAPNYSQMKNKGVIFQYKDQSVTLKEFKRAREPYWLPDFSDVFEWSIPFMADKILDTWTTITDLTEYDIEPQKKDDQIEVYSQNENGRKQQLGKHKKATNNSNLREFLNQERSYKIKNKMRVLMKLISDFSTAKNKENLKKKKEREYKQNGKKHIKILPITSKKILKSHSFNVSTSIDPKISTLERMKLLRPNIPNFYRSISHESKNFQRKLLKGYTKIWFETNKSNSNFQSKASISEENKQELNENEIKLLIRINSQQSYSKQSLRRNRTDSLHTSIELIKLKKLKLKNKSTSKNNLTRSNSTIQN
ncbi:serine/threonine-protein phosphatase 2b catalytic subunit 1-related [Anaeramoeba flamelloides]|uniref:Serine/threonine-protein phosphatase 2b catalytic subunit 1-related n=1 Tax=Anaeramoeba flamelloides TaxID=1746091 RepID=A0AAV7ZHR1_9EUKA|nr:serine/threonine-protein phosphatase 2b catalytic subunit 1-related [Anaeramoeba flamelloides]